MIGPAAQRARPDLATRPAPAPGNSAPSEAAGAYGVLRASWRREFLLGADGGFLS